MDLNVFFFFAFAFPFLSGVRSIQFTVVNNCTFTLWPGIFSGHGEVVSPSGFELRPTQSQTLDVVPPWSGRVWGRTHCQTHPSGKFVCETGDCKSGQIECERGSAHPTSLAEFTIKDNGEPDYYDINIGDGFNLPVSITPKGGSSNCSTTSCPVDVNPACAPELALVGPDGAVIGCKGACKALKEPQYCCTGDFNEQAKCPPSKYSKIFKDRCPQAYSYVYDDVSSTFLCPGGADYTITFCPSNVTM